MFYHFIKYAVRYLWRNKLFTLISIGGLTIGLACFILIVNYVQYEYSYDKFHVNSESLYRVNIIGKKTGTKAIGIGPPMGPALKAEFPEVESFVRIRHADKVLIRIEETEYYESKVFYVDSSFFNIFNFNLKQGDPISVLKEKNTAVLSEATAKRYFGDQNAIGKAIRLDDNEELIITGVASTPSTPSHFKFDILISFTSFDIPVGYPVTLDTWGWTSFPTYIRLMGDTDPEVVNEKFDDFIVRHMGEEASARLGLTLQPLTDAYLYSKDIIERNGIPTKGDINYVIILIAIAFLILVIAAFNFTNLAISLSLKRVKEIGVRKTMGAKRRIIFFQYCLEATTVTFISLVLAASCLEVFHPSFSTLFNAPFNLMHNLSTNWAYYLFIVCGIGLTSGFYPALHLSRLSPIKALKKGLTTNNNSMVKTILIGVQFIISIVLVVASVVIYDQMSYLKSKDLGYDRERVVGIQMSEQALSEKYEQTKQALLQKPYIKSVTVSDDYFDGQNGSVPIHEKNDQENNYRISLFAGHYDFAKTLGITILEGRDFSRDFAGDSSGFLLNESAVKMFGWKDSPIGKNLLLNDVWEGQVIGVVKDFNFASLHEAISPLIVLVPRTNGNNIFVKLGNGNLPEIIKSLEDDWKTLHPDLPFEYTFLDNHITNLYQSDQSFSSLVFTFSSLAIFLACIGLYGMVAFSIETKQKEIGIRKVLGASVSQVVFLLSKQFIVLLLVSSVIALPVSWILLGDWLSEFAYRISVSPHHLIIAIIGILLTVGITVSSRTIKAAQSNPVDILKEE